MNPGGLPVYEHFYTFISIGEFQRSLSLAWQFKGALIPHKPGKCRLLFRQMVGQRNGFLVLKMRIVDPRADAPPPAIQREHPARTLYRLIQQSRVRLIQQQEQAVAGLQ